MPNKKTVNMTAPTEFGRKRTITIDDLMGEMTGEDSPSQTTEKEMVPVPTPIVVEDGVSWIGNFGLSPAGLIINQDAEITEAEWRDFFVAIEQIKTAHQFILGDWAAFGCDAMGYSYEDIATFTGYSPVTIEIYASVCRNVNKFIRINSLGIAIHQVVASLSHEEQERWLKLAVEYKWSKRELQSRIESGDTEPAPARGKLNTPIDRFQRATEPYEGRVLKIAQKAAPEQRRQMAKNLRQLADRVEKGE